FLAQALPALIDLRRRITEDYGRTGGEIMEQQARASAGAISPVLDSGNTRRLSTFRPFQLLVRWEWPLRLVDPLLGDFDPFLPAYRVDPYPAYRKLQAKHRVYVARLLGGTCVASRYDDVVAVLGDVRFSVDRQQAQVFQRLQPFQGLSAEFTDAIQNA